uniref:Sorting nexin family member 21 n=1 Tax=Eptatretus burgeri TaxID=7764 RepID=A0A8C4QIH6_EPTBU
MASRLLNRLRSRKALEDHVIDESLADVEPGSSVLGGALRLQGGDEPEDRQDLEDDEIEENYEGSGVLVESGGNVRSGSSPLSKPLEENMSTHVQWQGIMRKSYDQLVFQVLSANISEDSHSKYVLYTFAVLSVGCDEMNRTIVARRYSDFFRLDQLLRSKFQSELSSVIFPKKQFAGNFTGRTIARRSRAFEQYLAHLASLSSIRNDRSFWNFFTMPELYTGHAAIRGGLYVEAYATLSNITRLQESIVPPPALYTELSRTLSALVVCCQDLNKLAEAQEHCQRALDLLDREQQKVKQRSRVPSTAEDPTHPVAQDTLELLLALLSSNIRLSWMIGKDKRQSEACLEELTAGGVYNTQIPTLKELIVKRYID